MGTLVAAKPLIYDFRCFTDYFSAFVENLQRAQAKFSYEWLARKLGVKSRSYLHTLKSGKTPPTLKFLAKICEPMELTDEEYDFALALVGIESARTMDEKAYYAERLNRLLTEKDTRALGDQEIDHFNHWYQIVIQELVNVKEFHEDPEWIAERLRGRIAADKISDSIKHLVEAGLLSRDDDGRLKKTSSFFKSPDGVPVKAVRTYHKDMMLLAAESIDSDPIEKRNFQCYTFAINGANVAEADHLIKDFVNKVAITLQKGPASEVYHLGVQFFPVTSL